ncbi:hypothetical protein JQ574_22795 [Bradyrhizobium sp. AUGA SZCCT0158]|uniref:hypothetical protein n=1 Tax=Bradyrhizobium sp. AUGA SZCCT0158 TaxID=2807661 RepID=UPI001BA70568|nr:hypothetical protein [Bradyrhizobium sp. AUGA SZCCT0158]MBR1198829.1 hypothetical protein [Bradyrhizobium sp. AUGA SZCCT0158]
MPVKFIPGQDDPAADLDGVDKHYYRNQVGPSSPFDTTHAFRWAEARAKDRARHNLIRAVRKEEQRLRNETFAGGVRVDSSLNVVVDDFSAEARQNVLNNRTIDGIAGAKDDAIKL